MSNSRDSKKGLQQGISRRDVLHGFGAAAAAAFVPGSAFADRVMAAEISGKPYYPASLTGMRGNHDGSFEIAHALARYGQSDFGPVSEPDADIYDLVVVGAGLSGLSAAHFFLKEHPDARVLLLDNHDDFGGHAKRNEFCVDGKRILGYGGSQSLEEPGGFPDDAKTLLSDLGIDINKLGDAYDQNFFKRHELKPTIHFCEEVWGKNANVAYELGPTTYIPLASSDAADKVVSQMPISAAARKEFYRLLTIDDDQLKMSAGHEEEYLYGISYRDFLAQHLDITEPEVFAILQDLTLDYGAGIEAVSADDALNWSGLPGAGATGHSGYEDDEPYIFHFPDGNASIARLLVRKMIPGVAPGSSAEDVVDAAFDYSTLDQASANVRLRLNSTVVNVKHIGDPSTAKTLTVEYVENGKAKRVAAKHCVLACYNAMIPSICPELPEQQRQALALPVKVPILYTNVALRNWRAWKDLGIGGGVAPGSYHPKFAIDFPVSYGGQQFPDDPDQPIVIHMERFPHRNNEGLSPREQKRLGRHELLSTPFATIEQNIRNQLSSLLSAADFDPTRDIAGITVNRWAHGYSDGFWDFGDPWLGNSNDERKPHVQGRKPFGRITIANSDAGGSAMFQAAVTQAQRAVAEIER